MPSPTPAREETPYTTPPPATDSSPSAESNATDADVGADGLVPGAAGKIATLLSDLKRELETSGNALVEVHGTLQILLKTAGASSSFKLEVASREEDVFVDVEAERPPNAQAGPVNGASAGADASNAIVANPSHGAPEEDATALPPYKRTRRDSDAELELELVPRKRQRLEQGDHGASMRQDAVDENDDIMPLITKEDLENIVAKLRDDIQEDTSECVNHVQKLLCRFKEEWHEKNAWEFEQASSNHDGKAATRSTGNGTTSAAAFPSAGADQNDHDITVPDLIKQESKLISSQIRWVEECRRIAADAHDKREETWRTSSASFHDKARQDREAFQGRMLHESSMQSLTLSQILNEVKAFNLYIQSMKWETPPSLSAGSAGPSYYPGPAAPAFPTQPPPAPPPPAPARGRGRGRGGVRGG